MAGPIMTLEACINRLTALQTRMAGMTVHLFTDALGGALSKTTTKAQLTTAEATYTGYAAMTIATLPLPYAVPGDGANLQPPTQQFQPTGTAVANMVRGWWTQTAAGDIDLAGQFDSDIPMADPTNAIPLDIIFNQPTGQ